MHTKKILKAKKLQEKKASNEAIGRRYFVGRGSALISSLLLGAGCQSIPVGRNSETYRQGQAGLLGTKSMVLYFVTHGSSADTFWAAQNNGWLDFCRAFKVDGRYIGTKMDGDVGEMRANLDSVLASGGGDGLAIAISNASMLDEPIRRAIRRGTPVIAVNVPDFRSEHQRIPYLRYVGGDPFQAGEANAAMALKAFRKLTGRAPRRSVYLIHVPGVDVLEIRGQGMDKILKAEGTKFEKLAVTFDPTQTREAVRAYLRAHPEVETVHTGSSRVGAWAVQEVRELGKLGNLNKPFKEGSVYIAGIDIDPELLRMIVSGDCIGTVDEQPYMQGWYGAQLLYHWVKYRFLPGQNILTGPFVIEDAETARLLIDQANNGLRA